MSFRIGFGVDFHQLGEGRDLMIGGVHIPHDKGAIGHSDADVLLHATGYCFVTGAGAHSPMFIHHRPSASDGVAEPVPGFVSGGPTLAARNDCGDLAYPSKFPAKSYLDSVCSYSTNEIAINWNAPLFFIMAAMDANQ